MRVHCRYERDLKKKLKWKSLYFFMIFNLQELHAVQKMEFSLEF